jgi:hypothetical protein
VTQASFRKTLSAAEPPAALSGIPRALWYGARGDWNQAHEVVQQEDGADAAWVHAWLHRIEGDLDNARYWYGQAGRPEHRGTTDDELGELLAAFLTKFG